MLTAKLSLHDVQSSTGMDKDKYFRYSEATTFATQLSNKKKSRDSFLRGFLHMSEAATLHNFGVAIVLMGTWGKKGINDHDCEGAFEVAVPWSHEWQVYNDELLLFLEIKHLQFSIKHLPVITTDKS